jgi:Kef-type K+ transport system membrane component KefB
MGRRPRAKLFFTAASRAKFAAALALVRRPATFPPVNSIEILVVLLLLFMAVPDVCRWLRRPALIYPLFVTFGLALRPLATLDVNTMIREAGQIGFLLLLFEVGLEIDLPRPRELVRPGTWVVKWVLIQYPLVLACATLAGLNWSEAFVAAAAITGCSVGMAHSAWKQHPGLAGEERAFALRVMVLLEMLAIVLLSVETAALAHAPTWLIALKLVGIAIAVFLVSRTAVRVTRLFQTVLAKATHWRLHFLVLLVLAICAVGERLGLAGAKTAFFLGLFMSRVEHDGKALEDFLAPLSRRFLIPLFFVALGMQVPMGLLVSRTALFAAITAALLIAVREALHRRWLNLGGGRDSYLLLCPNLTMVALAATAMLAAGVAPELAGWVILTGLFLSIAAIVALPPVAAPAPPAQSPAPVS